MSSAQIITLTYKLNPFQWIFQYQPEAVRPVQDPVASVEDQKVQDRHRLSRQHGI
jgi:hypothetical protein